MNLTFSVDKSSRPNDSSEIIFQFKAHRWQHDDSTMNNVMCPKSKSTKARRWFHQFPMEIYDHLYITSVEYLLNFIHPGSAHKRKIAVDGEDARYKISLRNVITIAMLPGCIHYKINRPSIIPLSRSEKGTNG